MSIIPPKAIDRRLMNAAATFNATPQDLSEAVNGQLTPAQASARLNEILNSITILDEVQERRLLLVQMTNFKDELMRNQHNPKIGTLITRMFKVISDQLERANVSADEISTKLGESHAVAFVEGFMKGFEAVVPMIEKMKEIEISEEEFKSIAWSGIEASKTYIEGVTEVKDV